MAGELIQEIGAEAFPASVIISRAFQSRPRYLLMLGLVVEACRRCSEAQRQRGKGGKHLSRQKKKGRHGACRCSRAGPKQISKERL